VKVGEEGHWAYHDYLVARVNYLSSVFGMLWNKLSQESNIPIALFSNCDSIFL
jgi:hypothetical protein